MAPGDRLDKLAENVASFGTKLDMFVANIAKLEEIVNGTAKTGGLKERLAIAENDVKLNKESFVKIDKNITDLRNEMLIEVGKIAKAVNDPAKAKGDFWTSVWQGAVKGSVAAIAVGVTGLIFWQVVIWLAANAPVK